MAAGRTKKAQAVERAKEVVGREFEAIHEHAGSMLRASRRLPIRKMLEYTLKIIRRASS